MKILHVIPGLTYEQGGTAATVAALARWQAADGHGVTVLTTDAGVRGGEHPLRLPGAVRCVAAASIGPARVAYAPGFGRHARALLRRCDVAHVHSVFNYPTHAALAAAAGGGCPVVISPQGMLQRQLIRRSLLSYAKKRSYLTVLGRTLRLACTAWHYTSENERRASWPHDRSRHFILPLGIDAAEYAVDRAAARAEVAARWLGVGGGPYVLYLGRIHPKKRPDLLVEAFLAGAPASYRLVVAGPDEGGTWGPIKERFLAEPAAAARVVSTGTVYGDVKVHLFAGAALFALPSLNENFGITVAEALGTGTPVLASPHVDAALEAAAAGLAETLPLDAGVWRDRLARLPADPGPPADFVRAARAWVQARYDWPAIARRFVERYAWAAASRRP
jgi:glycosyltransferase involved in cell wall biosynthesis